MAAALVKSGRGIVSYPTLFEAKPDPNKKLKYSVTLIFKKGVGAEPLKAAAEALLKEEYPDGKLPPRFKLPFRDGAEYADKDGYEAGDIFVQFSRNEAYGAPPVCGPNRLPIQRKDVYPGIWGCVGARPFTWHHQDTGNKGLSFSLEAFQKLADGEPIAGYAPVDTDSLFDDVSNDEELAKALGL
jgi:hypothetical protein